MEMVRSLLQPRRVPGVGPGQGDRRTEDMAEQYFFDLRVAQQRYLGTDRP